MAEESGQVVPPPPFTRISSGLAVADLLSGPTEPIANASSSRRTSSDLLASSKDHIGQQAESMATVAGSTGSAAGSVASHSTRSRSSTLTKPPARQVSGQGTAETFVEAPAYQYTTVDQIVSGRENIEYLLTIREQPKQSRMCGVGEKADRRPIDPAPIVQLRVITHPAPSSSKPEEPSLRRGEPVTTERGTGWEDKAWYLENPYFFMRAVLADAEKDEELHLLPDGKTRYAAGSCVSCLYHLRDIDGSHQGFFVFPDLSIRVEGKYRLKFSLFETMGTEVHHCKSVYSSPFVVYTAKRFPGMEESTNLSRSFAEQGMKVRVRKSTRGKRARAAGNKDAEETAGNAEADEVEGGLPSSSSNKRLRSDSAVSAQSMGDFANSSVAAMSHSFSKPGESSSRPASSSGQNPQRLPPPEASNPEAAWPPVSRTLPPGGSDTMSAPVYPPGLYHTSSSRRPMLVGQRPPPSSALPIRRLSQTSTDPSLSRQPSGSSRAANDLNTRQRAVSSASIHRPWDVRGQGSNQSTSASSHYQHHIPPQQLPGYAGAHTVPSVLPSLRASSSRSRPSSPLKSGGGSHRPPPSLSHSALRERGATISEHPPSAESANASRPRFWSSAGQSGPPPYSLPHGHPQSHQQPLPPGPSQLSSRYHQPVSQPSHSIPSLAPPSQPPPLHGLQRSHSQQHHRERSLSDPRSFSTGRSDYPPAPAYQQGYPPQYHHQQSSHHHQYPSSRYHEPPLARLPPILSNRPEHSSSSHHDGPPALPPPSHHHPRPTSRSGENMPNGSTTLPPIGAATEYGGHHHHQGHHQHQAYGHSDLRGAVGPAVAERSGPAVDDARGPLPPMKTGRRDSGGDMGETHRGASVQHR